MPDTAVTDDSTHVSASFWTANVRQQVIAQVTSGGKPAAGTAGRLIANTTDTRLELDTGAAYTEFLRWAGTNAHTPTVSQGVSTNIGKTVVASVWTRTGNVVDWWFDLTITASGTAGSAITLTIPVDASGISNTTPVGEGTFFDGSVGGGTYYVGMWVYRGSSTIQLIADGQTGFAGISPNVPLTNTPDVLRGHIRYPVA